MMVRPVEQPFYLARINALLRLLDHYTTKFDHSQPHLTLFIEIFIAFLRNKIH